MRRTLYQPSNQKALYCHISFLFTTRGEGNHVTFMGDRVGPTVLPRTPAGPLEPPPLRTVSLQAVWACASIGTCVKNLMKIFVACVRNSYNN
jgi:hypothetical protein